jgi:hypothetical protein
MIQIIARMLFIDNLLKKKPHISTCVFIIYMNFTKENSGFVKMEFEL